MPTNQKFQLRYSNRCLYHAIASPTIALIGAYLWASFYGNGEWIFWRNIGKIQEAGVFGILAYLILSALYEATMLIWRKGRKAGCAEGFAERQSAAIKDGRNEGKNIALTVAWSLSGTDEQKNLVRLAASDLDINLPAVLGHPYVTARLEVLRPWDVIWQRLADASAELRRRTEVDAFDVELDRMLRRAADVALADLRKRIERLPELDERRDGRAGNSASSD